MTNEELLFGRQLLRSQLPAINPNHLLKRQAMIIKDELIICNRCNTEFPKKEALLPDQTYYCANCISLGRVTSDDFLYYLPEPNSFKNLDGQLLFSGELTKFQKELSERVISVMSKRESLLLWAVTGAGKTEMMFPGLEWAFQKGMRVCWATPRIDVVIELAPRLKKVFPRLPFVVLYGSNQDPYVYTQFVLCTTHQLWRFYEAFDVLIIDEVDSFPYAGNVSLKFGADRAAKKNGSRIYLSATPPDELTKKVPVAYLPLRFHGHPLPMPKLVYLRWRNSIEQKHLPLKLIFELKKGLKKNERYLIFVSEVKLISKFIVAFKRAFPNVSCEGVFAGDKCRQEKVSGFREGLYQVLFTTTILERGVTIFHINVIVVGAESKIFNWYSLVQIAGRAGRDKVYFADRVLFYFNSYTKDIKKAVKQIKHLNLKAGFDA